MVEMPPWSSLDEECETEGCALQALQRRGLAQDGASDAAWSEAVSVGALAEFVVCAFTESILGKHALFIPAFATTFLGLVYMTLRQVLSDLFEHLEQQSLREKLQEVHTAFTRAGTRLTEGKTAGEMDEIDEEIGEIMLTLDEAFQGIEAGHGANKEIEQIVASCPELCDPLVIRLLFLKLDLAPISYYVAGKTPFAKVRSLDPVEPTHQAYQSAQRDGQENAFHSELNASHTFLKVGSQEKLFFCVTVPLLAVPGRCRSRLQPASTGSLLEFGKSHSCFADPGPHSWVCFAPACPACPSKEAGNLQRRMIFVLGKPLGSGGLDAPLLEVQGRCRGLQQASTGSFLYGAPVKGDGGHVWQAIARVTRLATQASARHLHREGHIRHGLLAAKIAKHEHLQSIKTRICPLSPEQRAPSFSRKPMMSIDVGVRVRQGNYSELRQMCAAESTFIIPVKELLRQHGTPLALLACIEGTLFAAADGLSNLVLVGHSFGISVAHQLSTHLERQGVRVFGIVVALDLRHGSTSVPPVPTSLADFASRFDFQSSWGHPTGMFTLTDSYGPSKASARSHFRLTVSTLDLSTPLVPRGQLHARDFASATKRSATASWLPTAMSHVSAVVNDMDHLDVANTRSWDIATRLHRSGKSRKEAGNSRHRMMLILGEPLQFEALSAHRKEDLQHIARTIQGSMNCASRDESAHIWLARRLLQVVYDHRHYNGQQLVELLLKNRDPLRSIEGSYVVNEFVLVRPSVERLSSDLGEVLRCWRQHQESGERWATVVPTRGGIPFFYGNVEQEEPARGDIYGIVFNPNGANCFCSFLHHKEIHDPYQSERVHKFASKLQLQPYNCVTSSLADSGSDYFVSERPTVAVRYTQLLHSFIN
eukprot:symbB.v1.2.029901.t1/scaffold3318.1/size84623/10